MKLQALLGVCAAGVLAYGVWALRPPILWYPAAWALVAVAFFAARMLWNRPSTAASTPGDAPFPTEADAGENTSGHQPQAPNMSS